MKKINWVNTPFLFLTPIAAVLLSIWAFKNGPITLWHVVPLLLLFPAGSMSITAGYHRYYSHLSYRCNRLVQLFYLLFGASAFEGSLLEWAYDHRKHHRFVDTDRDPYNINRGFFYAHMGWLLLDENRFDMAKVDPDLTQDRLVMWQHKYYVPIAIAMGFFLPWGIGWLCGNALFGLAFGGFVRVVVTNHCTFLINSLAHTYGKKSYDGNQTARDSFLMAFLAYGEGYHNYHHRFASDYRNGIRWYHWDPTKWLIQGLAAVGMASKLKAVASSEILAANLKQQHQNLLNWGASPERLAQLRGRIDEAQKRWKALKEEYQRVKESMIEHSRYRQAQMKAEMRLAKLEFQWAMRQWVIYSRSFRARPVPVTSR